MPIFPSLALAPLRGARRRSFLSSPFSSSRASGLGLCLCLALGWGCAKQGEGERCDINSGNLDCETGLVCRGEADLSIKGKGVALCCPVVTAETTVDACRTFTSLPDEMLDPTESTPSTGSPSADDVTPTPEPVLDAGAQPADATPAP